VVLAYLDAIMAAGFDGVYLDKVDIFAYWMDTDYGNAPFENESAALQMAAWVTALSEYAREGSPTFLVVPQNGAEIVAYLGEDQVIEYVSSIDAIAVEDTFFCPVGWREGGNNPPYNPQEELLDLLDAYHVAGFPVLAVDYVTQPGKIRRFVEEAQAHGFIPYTTTRALDELTSASGN
jgi:cysteinyl-tRNA synthetase